MKTIGIIVVLVQLLAGIVEAGEVWPQWGGPNRDFTVDGRELSQSWGEDGPRMLWSRSLGGGFAGIVSDGKALYTMYRDGDDEIIVALDPGSGETRWEHRYSAPVPKVEYLSTEYGKGPNSTPLLVDGKIVTFGFMGHVRCLDVRTGEVLWAHSVADDFKVPLLYFGHASSPMSVGGNVLIVAGGLLAFDLDNGKLAWENRDFGGNYGSPVLLAVNGKKQIVTPVHGHLAGFDAKTGKTLWSVEHKNQWGTILHTPVVDDAGRVLVSAHQIGSRLVDPAASGENRQVWHSEGFEVAHSNAVRSGDYVFTSTGASVAFLAAMSLRDGKLAWKERGFAQSNLLRVGDTFLLLDFDGELALLKLDGEGMKVITQATINERPCWTPPTLLGTTLYFRDETRIAALDLSSSREN